jgi:putative multicomponent Na+:H+ antiporter subunit B
MMDSLSLDNFSYVYAIMLLLPLAAAMVLFQQNPYQALVMRGILGAVAALIYAMLGGADVALTEALVGTMLAITLYAVAVRSSLVMRLGVLEAEEVKDSLQWQPLLDYLRARLKRYQLRLELVPYADRKALQHALAEKAIHSICLSKGKLGLGNEARPEENGPEENHPCPTSLNHPPYQITTRVPRLYEILTAELPPAMAKVMAAEAAKTTTGAGDRPPLTTPPAPEDRP